MTGLLLVVIFGVLIAFGLYKAFWNLPVERIIDRILDWRHK